MRNSELVRINPKGSPAMRTLLSTALALALSTANLSAAEVGPLAPGKPAGVKKADYEGDPTLFIVLGVAVIIGIAIAASSGGGNGNTANNGGTTTTTS
jgi:hypothetical protein